MTIKNTFLDFRGSSETSVPRSNSVPRAFKPGRKVSEGWPHGDNFSNPYDKYTTELLQSDDSTNASEKDATETFRSNCSDSEEDFPDCCSDCTEDFNDFMHPLACISVEDRPKVTLNLDDMVKTKLKTQVQPFKPVSPDVDEVASVIKDAVDALSKADGVFDVTVNDGGMGGTTMIVGKFVSGHEDQDWMSMVQDAIRGSTERKESTYLLGYGAQPFKNQQPFNSFSAKIVRVPSSHRGTACWTTYEKGSCGHLEKCLCDHPSETDMMRLIVMLKKAA